LIFEELVVAKPEVKAPKTAKIEPIVKQRQSNQGVGIGADPNPEALLA
jgi:hypothetical protein